MVNMTDLRAPGVVFEIALVDYYGKELLVKSASQYRNTPYLYYIGPFIPPRGMFFIRVRGEDDKHFEFQRILQTAFSADSTGAPK